MNLRLFFSLYFFAKEIRSWLYWSNYYRNIETKIIISNHIKKEKNIFEYIILVFENFLYTFIASSLSKSKE